jgi:hypothetical protein
MLGVRRGDIFHFKLSVVHVLTTKKTDLYINRLYLSEVILFV